MEDDKKTVEEKPVEEKPAEEKPIDEKKIYGIIYVIINLINGKKYVGQTTRTVEERFREHAKADSFIGKAIRKYGEENFKGEVLEKCYSAEELNAAEIKWIKELDCKAPNGYNLTGGGAGVVNLLKVIRERGAQKRKGRKGHPSFWKGKKMPAKSCAKMSAAKKGKAPWNKGKKMSAEYCATMSKAQKGKKLSDEARINISASLLGNTYCVGNKNHLGHKHSDETRKIMSIKRRLRVTTDETRNKMKESQKKRWAKIKVQKENLKAAQLQKILAKKCLNRQ